MRSQTLAGIVIVLLASSAAAQVHVHDAADHGAPADAAVEYLTLNVASGSAVLPNVPGGLVAVAATASLGVGGVLIWMTLNGKARKSQLS